MPRRRSRTRGVLTHGTGHGAAIPVSRYDALSVKRPVPPLPPGSPSVYLAGKVTRSNINTPVVVNLTPVVVSLMDQFSLGLGLTVRESHSTRVYRYGSRGPAVWIEQTQGRLVVDPRTLALKFPTADVPTLHTTISRLFLLSNASDQPGIKISSLVVERWDALRGEVLEPFFRASMPG